MGTSIWDMSTTAASNTSTGGVSTAEGCAPSTVNDAQRAAVAMTLGALKSVTAAGTDTYTATLAPVPDALSDGMLVQVRFTNANTSATPTLNINSLGAKTIKKLGGSALVAGDIPAAHDAILRYVSATTYWQLLNPAAAGIADATNGGVTIAGTPSATTIALNPNDLTAKASPVGADSVVINDVAGGNVAKKATITSLLAVTQPFTKTFTSSGQTITAAGALTLAHSLGAEPFGVAVTLVCGTNDSGYTAGQHLDIGVQTDGAAGRGVSIIKDATNLTIRYSSNANTFSILNATTGAATSITNASWTAIFRAWV